MKNQGLGVKGSRDQGYILSNSLEPLNPRNLVPYFFCYSNPRTLEPSNPFLKLCAFVPLCLLVFSLSCLLPVKVFAGDITGKVTITSKLKKKKKGKQKKKTGGYNTGDFLSKKTSKDEGKAETLDEAMQVVVYIVDAGKKYSHSGKNPKMAQKDKAFAPHVLPVVAGSEVDFPNYDNIFHNVYTESSVAKFELPEYKSGDSRSKTLSKTGVIELFCGIHTNMNAYIIVLQNPFFDMLDSSHKYSIKNVPPGDYLLRAWHPRVEKVAEKKVSVPAAGSIVIDLSL